jgi:serine-type D-Ala-D-Ala carboxypeptidase/endopeptidase (penicillin-binding protein 4)
LLFKFHPPQSLKLSHYLLATVFTTVFFTATRALAATQSQLVSQSQLASPAVSPPAITPIVTAPDYRQLTPMTNGRSETIAPPQIAAVSIGGICPDQLPAAIDQIIQQQTYSTAKWGIHIESINSQMVLYSHNANEFLIPASNVKLFTTAAALQTVSSRTEGAWKNFETEIATINRDSNNDYADHMLNRIGGVRHVQAQLSQLGIDPDSYRQVDGSGLSRRNATTPVTLVTLLKSLQYSPAYQQFYTSLPIGGVNGTLRNRFLNTPVQGRIHAKTGTLTGVRALSGYLEHPVYGTIVFSILANQPNRGDSLRRAIDAVVLKVGQMAPCS